MLSQTQCADSKQISLSNLLIPEIATTQLANDYKNTLRTYKRLKRSVNDAGARLKGVLIHKIQQKSMGHNQ